MGWVLVCVVVALLGAVFLFLHAREVFRKGRLLLAEIETAAARAGAASQPVPSSGAPPAHSNGT